MKAVQLLMNEVNGWTFEVRLRGMQALETLFRFSEHNLTGYTGPILQALLHHLADPEPAIRVQSAKVAESLARYVEADIFLDILSPIIQQSGTLPSAKANAVYLFAHLLRGLRPAKRLRTHLDRIVALASDRSLAESDHTDLLQQLSFLLITLLECLRSDQDADSAVQLSDDQSFSLYYSLLCLQSPATDLPELVASANKSLDIFVREIHGLSGADELSAKYGCSRLIPELMQSLPQWTRYSAQLRMFRTFVMQSPRSLLEESLFSKQVWEGLLFPLAVADLKSTDSTTKKGADADYDMRSYVLDLISELLKSNPVEEMGGMQFSLDTSRQWIQAVIIPNGVWRGGRRAEEVRRKCMDCVWLLTNRTKPMLDAGAVKEDLEQFESASTNLLKVLVACTDEDIIQTRVDSLSILRSWFQDTRLQGAWTEEQAKHIYPELMKRLDDSQDSVRILAAQTLQAFLSHGACPSTLDEVHFDAMIKGILIHLDDSNVEVQSSVFDLLRQSSSSSSKGGALPLTLLRQTVKDVQGKYRCVHLLERLLLEEVSSE